MKQAYIIDALRTPRARKKGKFLSVHPVDLLTFPLQAVLKRNSVQVDEIEDVLVGCVTQTGEQGWCVGRQSVLAAGFPETVPSTTINRLCGSGQQAFNFAASGIQSGIYICVLAGGVEHMTRVPMFSDIGGEQPSPFLKKHYPDLVQQGLAAELLAQQFVISREASDEFSYTSQMNARNALQEGRFQKSLCPVVYTDSEGEKTLDKDDTVRAETTIEGLSGLKPAFKEHGIITAGSASAIVDGAAILLLASEEKVKQDSLKPRARVVSQVSIGSDPLIMLSGPIEASKQVLLRAGLKKEDIDLWEINEAFAPVPLATIKTLDIDPLKVNVNGGGISLGHPLGATGAMLINTAVDELERISKRYALITMCIGLGMGIATIIERV
jgi:acetyl-CoA acetyltransferase family protein